MPRKAPLMLALCLTAKLVCRQALIWGSPSVGTESASKAEVAAYVQAGIAATAFSANQFCFVAGANNDAALTSLTTYAQTHGLTLTPKPKPAC